MRPLNSKHFDQWNKLFNETVDEHFNGEKAKLIKQRALTISTVMQQKIFHVNKDVGHL